MVTIIVKQDVVIWADTGFENKTARPLLYLQAAAQAAGPWRKVDQIQRVGSIPHGLCLVLQHTVALR